MRTWGAIRCKTLDTTLDVSWPRFPPLGKLALSLYHLQNLRLIFLTSSSWGGAVLGEITVTI